MRQSAVLEKLHGVILLKQRIIVTNSRIATCCVGDICLFFFDWYRPNVRYQYQIGTAHLLIIHEWESDWFLAFWMWPCGKRGRVQVERQSAGWRRVSKTTKPPIWSATASSTPPLSRHNEAHLASDGANRRPSPFKRRVLIARVVRAAAAIKTTLGWIDRLLSLASTPALIVCRHITVPRAGSCHLGATLITRVVSRRLRRTTRCGCRRVDQRNWFHLFHFICVTHNVPVFPRVAPRLPPSLPSSSTSTPTSLSPLHCCRSGRLVLVSRPLFKGSVSDLEAFLLVLVSVLDWTD